MYLEFYGLREKPFSTTPDPRFLFLTRAHREALAQLVYGVTQGTGFMVLSGEVGTGKTTLLRALLRRLDSNTAVAFLSQASLAIDGVLEYMLEDFGIGKGEQSTAQRLVALNRFLIETRRAGQNALLILDEAQGLDVQTLEQIRLLSNFETPTDKLLQIILAGQPELRTKLEHPDLRQLMQRVALRCRIPTLAPEETRLYIRTRLRVAGARDLSLFSERAIEAIGRYAGGVPRIINVVCDHCLVTGYGMQAPRIDHRLVEEAIEYFGRSEGSGRPRGRGRPARAVAWQRWGIAAAIGGAGGYGVVALGLPRLLTESSMAVIAFAVRALESVRLLLLG
jgi:general secretion pathway protein A